MFFQPQPGASYYRQTRTTRHPLEHQLWKVLKEEGLIPSKILVALSGGVDSVALLVALKKVLKKRELAACYVHHGKSTVPEIRKYRKQAQNLCRSLCSHLGVDFYLLSVEPVSQSEEEMRKARYEAIEKLMDEAGFEVIALAHHQEDLLETRLIRLIRGTTQDGVRSMKIREGRRFRPFLELSKSVLRDFVKTEGVPYLEDPTNLDVGPMRNWIRHTWLPLLEGKRPGSIKSLARSLEDIVQGFEKDQGIKKEGKKGKLEGQFNLLLQNKKFTQGLGISRSFYLSLSPLEQNQLIAQYLIDVGAKSFSRNHILEIKKYLDKEQNVHRFKVVGFLWRCDAHRVMVVQEGYLRKNTKEHEQTRTNIKRVGLENKLRT